VGRGGRYTNYTKKGAEGGGKVKMKLKRKEGEEGAR